MHFHNRIWLGAWKDFPPFSFLLIERARYCTLLTVDGEWWVRWGRFIGTVDLKIKIKKREEKRRKWICRVQPYRSSGFQHLASKTPRRLIRTSLNNTHKIVSSVAGGATGPVDRGSGADITSSVAIRPEERRKCYPLSYCIAVHNSTRHGRNEQNKKKKNLITCVRRYCVPFFLSKSFRHRPSIP